MEEISLKEYIEVILKGKKLVAIITVACMALGLVVGFASPKVYEAKAILLTNPINSTKQQTNTSNGTLNNLIDSMSEYPEMDVNAYKEQFLNSDVVTKTIQALNLTDKKGTYITANSLRDKVTVENPEDTNLLNITVKDNNPELAANIANTLCDYFSQFISEISRSQGKTSSNNILEQMNVEKEKLAEESDKLTEYLMNSPSIDALNSQISEMITQLSRYKTNLNDVKSAITSDKLALQKLLGTNQSTLSLDVGDISIDIPNNTTNTTNTNPDKNSTLSFDISSPNRLQNSLLTMEITNTETRLNNNLAKEIAITDSINKIESDLAELQSMRAQEQSKYNAILRDYNLAEQTYNAYQEKYKEATITAASDLGRVSIQISSAAVPPEDPSNLGKAIILAISMILGLMIGVFVVFFKEYWNTPSNEVALKK